MAAATRWVTMTDSEIMALQAQIRSLEDRMEKGFTKLEGIMTGVESRVRTVENKEAACSPIMNSRVEAAWREINKQAVTLKIHEEKFNSFEDTLDKLVQTNNILKWLLGVITTIGTATLIKLLFGG